VRSHCEVGGRVFTSSSLPFFHSPCKLVTGSGKFYFYQGNVREFLKGMSVATM